MTMQTEYEATFGNVNKKDVRNQLRLVGGVLERAEYLQKRINFSLPKESSYYETGWMRVRDEGDKVTMSIKAVADKDVIESQKEICLVVDNFQMARDFALSLGCQEKSYQESKRELWMLGDVEICIDEWPWLEPFVEIESTSEEKVREVPEQLGFDWKEALFGAVDMQYEKKYGVSKRVINNETPRFVFGEPCPFLKDNS